MQLEVGKNKKFAEDKITAIDKKTLDLTIKVAKADQTTFSCF